MAQANGRTPSGLRCRKCDSVLEYEHKAVGARTSCERDPSHDVGNRLAGSGCPACEKVKATSTIRTTVVWGTVLVCPNCEG